MKNNESIYAFLQASGFGLIERNASAFFGDYYDIFTSESFQLRFSSSKSSETIDIRNNQPRESWYDLALGKAHLYDEKGRNPITLIEEHRDFLQKELTNIAELFNERNFFPTKRSLEKLGNERANKCSRE